MTDSGSMAVRPRASIQLGRMPDGSGLLLDTRSASAYAVNATAAEVWELCDGRRTPDDITAALLERYEATPEEVAGSVELLLAHLRELGVLEPPLARPDPAAVVSKLPLRRRYDLLGFRVEVASNSEILLETLDRMNTEFTADGSGMPMAYYEARDCGDDRWELTYQAKPLRCYTSLLRAVGHVEWHIVDRTINWHRHLVHSHGAALAGREASVLLPGTSGIGKTTFALALKLRGLRLYSDDVVFLPPDTWRPLPFPRTLHVHADALERLGQLGLHYEPEEHLGRYLCASALRPWEREPGPPLRYVIFPELDRQGPLVLEPLPDAEAAVLLMRFSHNLRRQPRFGLDLLPPLLETVECYRLRRNDDLMAAADLVYQLVTEGE